MHGPRALPSALLPEHDAYLSHALRRSMVSVHDLAPTIFRAYRLDE